MEAAAPSAGTELELEELNDLARSTLRAVAKAITRGASEQGHCRLTIEFQDGLPRRGFYEIGPIGGSELVTT